MRSLTLLAILVCHNQELFSWGFFAHAKINELCVYAIPKPLFGFYKQNLNYMSLHSADADKRRYILETEACKHYLDGDFYESVVPLDTLPRIYSDAIKKYGEDTVKAHGIVTWNILRLQKSLTSAFLSKDVKQILKLSADIGHYIGDCHVPLHSSSNYNGQKTGQKGIHALWESRLPELFFDQYDLYTELGEYLESVPDSVWKIYEESFSLADSVLRLERNLTLQFNEDTKYSWEKRGNQIVKVYSTEFCQAYQEKLGTMVEDRMKSAIELIASVIYTAWVDAGSPELEAPEEEETPVPTTVLPEKQTMLGRDEE